MLEADRIGALPQALGARYLRLEEDAGRRGSRNGREHSVYRTPPPIPPPPPHIPPW